MTEVLLPEEYVEHLGSLRMKEVYSFYDFPRIFSAVNATGQLFLALCVEDDLNEDYEYESRWLYVPLTPQRLSLIKRGELPLRTAFTSPEGRACFSVELIGKAANDVSILKPRLIPDEDLPVEGVALQVESVANSSVARAADEALQSMREILDLHIEIPTIKSLEIPLTLLGEVASSLQAVLDSIMQNLMNKPSLHGRIPQIVLDESELRFREIFPGSFGARLAAAKHSDLVDPLISDALGVLINLVSAGDDDRLLREVLEMQNQRTANRYARLLKAIYSSKCDVGFDWGSSNIARGGKSYLKSATARSAFDLVHNMEEHLSGAYIVRAKLTGWVDRSRTFVALSDDGAEYRGKVCDELFARQVSPRIHAIYDMKIVDRLEESSMHNGEKSTYILQDFTRIKE